MDLRSIRRIHSGSILPPGHVPLEIHGIGGGIYLSNDGGRNWQQVLSRDQHVYDVTIDPRNPDVLYAAGFESSAWKSSDRGEHWSTHCGAELQMDASRDPGSDSFGQNLHHDIWRRRMARRCKCKTWAAGHRNSETPTRPITTTRVNGSNLPFPGMRTECVNERVGRTLLGSDRRSV